VFRDLSDKAGLGVVAGAASARGASTRAAASAGEEEEKNIFQWVTKVRSGFERRKSDWRQESLVTRKVLVL
jgi:hypothetical protein